MKPLTKWSLAVALVGLLVMTSISAGNIIRPNPFVSLQMGITPQIPKLGETAEVVAKVYSLNDLPKAEISFGPPDAKQLGVEMVGTPAKQTFSIKQGENKEFRFKIKFVGPKWALVTVTVRALEVRNKDGSSVKSEFLKSWADQKGYTLVLREKDNKFYLPNTEPKEDPDANFQKELGFPKGDYWYSIALHLREDVADFAKAKGITFDRAKELFKDRAERMSRDNKIEMAKAYEAVLTKRIMWREANLPDPTDYRYAPKEREVKACCMFPRKDLGYRTTLTLMAIGTMTITSIVEPRGF